jgi:peptidoglycan hydrolase-like protein with peptidoglycan-binding domain
VQLLQQQLQQFGLYRNEDFPRDHYYHVDGEYGTLTEAAVSQYQAEHALHPTGDVDEKTWNSLFSKKPKQTEAPGCSP